MVQQTRVELLDDLDGSKAERTVRFALDGAEYEMELSKRHDKDLAKILAPYVAAGRPLVGPKSKPARRVPVGPSSVAVRAWAEAQGVSVPARGRIPKDVIAQYEAAGN